MSGNENLSVEEAEELIHEVSSQIQKVQDDYPDLTDELAELLDSVSSHLILVYLRLGREDESPSLTELAERYDDLMEVRYD